MTNDQDGVPEKCDDRSTLKTAREVDLDKFQLEIHLQSIPDFGLWNPNIKDVNGGVRTGHVAAVDSGRLKASFVQRSLEEQVIPEETHINNSDLVEWIQERGYEPGDHWNDWLLPKATLVNSSATK